MLNFLFLDILDTKINKINNNNLVNAKKLIQK